MDILDFIENKDGYFFKGYYRKFKDSEPQFFTYKIIPYFCKVFLKTQLLLY